MLKAVIFDFDGLILDTETPEYVSFRDIYRAHGVELELDAWGQWVGTDASSFNPYDHLDRLTGRALNREEIRAARRAAYDALIAKEELRPGVLDYLRSARQLGLKVGLASSSTRAWVAGYLDKLGIADYFDCIRVREDVERVKPDPALYLAAAAALGVAPSESLALEDSPNGALAAKRAGMRCVIVPNDLTGRLTFGEADMKLNSLAETDLRTLLHALT
ncbi:HAD-IA family hydrolase [Paenibacillus arenilitoris]|uniref:HAD-IA family hydrolase n=1 Tax=Paenibacillus arenilitoris TaxID=2772299 RepID=A0A927CLY0_9BACL|nr:HAD-IA family hydrolase [Paenibacillus arenilitoris]MBD2869242.1 HAD-IA family hydrolase [Paenibacillus arenilitoris]